MARIKSCKLPPPYRKKGIPIEIPMDWDVLNAFHDEKGDIITVVLKDGRIETINPQMLISYEDITPSRKYSNAIGNKMAIEKVEEKIEKLFTQPKELFEAIDFSELDVIDASEKHMPL